MTRRRLGKSNIEVSAIGLGCMGLSEFYGSTSSVERSHVVRHAMAAGITLIDTADMYGLGDNEILIGRAVRRKRHRVVLATKCGIARDASGAGIRNGKPSYLIGACEASLHRLQTDHVDILYLHRVDPGVPLEESIGAMSRLVEQGKTRAIGLSKVNAATLARAESVHPIAAVQNEYSIVDRDVEAHMLGTCRARECALVAYSPLCRGLLSGKRYHVERLSTDDTRRVDPRFDAASGDRVARIIGEIAAENACTPTQVALAWLLSRGRDVIPIPGMRSRRQVDESVRAVTTELPASALQRLEALDVESVSTVEGRPSS
jgi:aryl-alcohol dehydrogenase-like predicted oxidoreductase